MRTVGLQIPKELPKKETPKEAPKKETKKK